MPRLDPVREVARLRPSLADWEQDCGRVVPTRKLRVTYLAANGWPTATVQVVIPQFEHRGKRIGQRTSDAAQLVGCVPRTWLTAYAELAGVPFDSLVRWIVPDAPGSKRKHRATDGPKGHWPAGKRRKPPTGRSVRTMLGVSVRQRGLRATARLLGVDPRTVARWQREERYPDAEEVGRIVGLAIAK